MKIATVAIITIIIIIIIITYIIMKQNRNSYHERIMDLTKKAINDLL